MRESAVRFGPSQQLAGIVTEGEGPTKRPPLVLVTAGLVPKAGPHRLYAELARRVAKDGTATLRFDLGGIGDSGQPHAGRPLAVRTALEIRAAVELIAGSGSGEVVLAGLCSGGEDAFRYAEGDPRVRGVLMI